MTQPHRLKHEFVESFPKNLEDDTVYVSVVYATAAHKCCCGCGQKVITPIAPYAWQLLFDGESISLSPSIGNWNFVCQSHYWIKSNEVRWAGKMSREEVEVIKVRDRADAARYWEREEIPSESKEPEEIPVEIQEPATGIRERALRWMGRFGWRKR